jgi:uncharacterized membrane protein
MVAKLVLGIIALVIVIGLIIAMSYRYLSQKERHKHKKEMLRKKQQHDILQEDLGDNE